MAENFSNPNLNLACTARQFDVSEGYLSSCFKEAAGICFADHLENIRIKKACELLASSDKTIVEIAEKTGASTATISRVNRSLNYGSDGYEKVFERLQIPEGGEGQQE